VSYLFYLCLFAYSGVQHILCCVFCFVCLPLDLVSTIYIYIYIYKTQDNMIKFTYCGVQHNFHCVFVLFCFRFVYPMLPVSLDWLLLRFSLSFIYLS